MSDAPGVRAASAGPPLRRQVSNGKIAVTLRHGRLTIASGVRFLLGDGHWDDRRPGNPSAWLRDVHDPEVLLEGGWLVPHAGCRADRLSAVDAEGAPTSRSSTGASSSKVHSFVSLYAGSAARASAENLREWFDEEEFLREPAPLGWSPYGAPGSCRYSCVSRPGLTRKPSRIVMLACALSRARTSRHSCATASDYRPSCDGGGLEAFDDQSDAKRQLPQDTRPDRYIK